MCIYYLAFKSSKTATRVNMCTTYVTFFFFFTLHNTSSTRGAGRRVAGGCRLPVAGCLRAIRNCVAAGHEPALRACVRAFGVIFAWTSTGLGLPPFPFPASAVLPRSRRSAAQRRHRSTDGTTVDRDWDSVGMVTAQVCSGPATLVKAGTTAASSRGRAS